jgi:hypothetical protein
VRLTGRLLTHGRDGEPFKPGIVVHPDEQHAYLVEPAGNLRRVRDLVDATGTVQYHRIRAATKAEKKAMKRERARARSAVLEAALRVARQTQVEGAHA